MSTLVTQAEFARMAGVNRSTVHKWVKAGRIAVEPSGLIDPAAAMRMREATESPLPHHQARKAQFEHGRMGVDMDQAEKIAPRADSGRPATGETGAATGKSDVSMQGHRKPADVYMERKAEKIAIEIDRLAGALVERAEVDYVLADFGNTLRGLLEGLPDRLAGALAAHRGDVNAIHKALDDAAHDLLMEMSELMKRKMESISAA